MKSGMFKMPAVSITLFVLALMLFPVGAVAFDAEIPELFSSPSVSGAQRWNRDEPWVVRSRTATVNLGRAYEMIRRLRSASSFREMVSLNLFEDVTLTARIDRVEETFSQGFSCYGTVAGYAQSEVIMVISDTVVSANIVVPGSFYQVRFAAPGLHRVQKIDRSAFPSELSPIPIRVPRERGFVPTARDSGDYIDILVCYTTEAASAAGGAAAMRNDINLMISETNKGYANSGISQRLRLVHTMEVSYSEAGFNWSTTLDRFRRTTDGYMDSVHGMRDTYGADAAVLIVNNSGSCGIAYVMQGVSTSFASFAFAVVSRSCATGYYSFAHELGHVMGSGHDRDNASVTGAYDYSFGYQAPDEGFRTIMAYNCPGGCNRYNYWSNPDKNYEGQPMGVDYTDPLAADNRRSLNNTAPTVASFRESAVILTVNKDGIGSGAVTSTPGGITCGGDCAQEYPAGELVTLSALPDLGSTFTGWSGGGCSGVGPCTVSMSSSKTVTATFDKARVGLAVQKSGNGSGTITSSPTGISCGEDCQEDYPLGSYVTLYAYPDGSSTFVGWSGGGCSGTGSCRVAMDSAKTVTAAFSHSNVSLAIDKEGKGTGTVSSSPSGINCGGDCRYEFTVGATVTLSASPAGGSIFAGWIGGGCSGTGPCTVTLNSDTVVSALFDTVTFYLRVATEGTGNGTIISTPAGIDCGDDCSEDYAIGSEVDLTAQPDAGSEFAGWSGTGYGDAESYTITMNGNRIVTARFENLPSAFEQKEVLYLTGLFPSDGDMTEVTIVNSHEDSVSAGIDFYSALGVLVGHHDISIGARGKTTVYGDTLPEQTASAIVSAERDLLGFIRQADGDGKRSAWAACTHTVSSFSIPHVAAGTSWKTGLHFFNPMDNDAHVTVIYDSETATDVVIQGKATYSLVVEQPSGTTTPSYIETSQPLTAVEFFDCVVPGGDKAAINLGGEPLTELLVPDIFHDERGWTGIGIGCPIWPGNVVAFGSTPEAVFDLAVVGAASPCTKVSANLSATLAPQVPWARVLGVNFDLVGELNTYVVPLQGLVIYGDPVRAKIGAVSLNALRFEHGMLGVVSPPEDPIFIVLNPNDSAATLGISAYGNRGDLLFEQFLTLEAGTTTSIPLSQYPGGSDDCLIEVDANLPLYGYEIFTTGGRMEMLPVLQ